MPRIEYASHRICLAIEWLTKASRRDLRNSRSRRRAQWIPFLKPTQPVRCKYKYKAPTRWIQHPGGSQTWKLSPNVLIKGRGEGVRRTTGTPLHFIVHLVSKWDPEVAPPPPSPLLPYHNFRPRAPLDFLSRPPAICLEGGGGGRRKMGVLSTGVLFGEPRPLHPDHLGKAHSCYYDQRRFLFIAIITFLT